MKAIDFIFYNLVLFFEKRKKTGTNVDPILRTMTVLSVLFILWAMQLTYIGEFLILGTIAAKVPFYIFILVGILSSLLIKHIYITKKRYAHILEKNDLNFKLYNLKGQTLVIGFIIFSFIIFFLTAFLMHALK